MKSPKTFIFKYDPTATPHQMFANMWKAVDTGKPNIQPKNVLVSNSLEAIYRCITPSRWEIFTCLVEKKPANLTELARLLNKDYANVWKDAHALAGLEIIRLKKESKEIRPIALYERVVFDLKVNKELPPHGLILQANLWRLDCQTFKGLIDSAKLYGKQYDSR